MQPIHRDKAGVIRFFANPIVVYMLEHGPWRFEHLALSPSAPFSMADRMQFGQLIGMPVADYGVRVRRSRARCCRHPMQPIYRDRVGIARFHENRIVVHLLFYGPFTSTQLGLNGPQRGAMAFSDDDLMQLAQLIGLSVEGFCVERYASRAAIARAKKIAAALPRARKRERVSVI